MTWRALLMSSAPRVSSTRWNDLNTAVSVLRGTIDGLTDVRRCRTRSSRTSKTQAIEI